MDNRRQHSMRRAVIDQAKREGRAWAIALAIIITYWGARLWLT
jgi:hypothetical protein